MARSRRFERSRYIGTRDTMCFYDCDDDVEFELLEGRIHSDDLLDRCLLSTFAPDVPAEARNRGFRPVRKPLSTTALVR
jgi:hypothetical protein